MARNSRFTWGPGDLVKVPPKSENHLPALLDALRPTLTVIGGWAGVGRSAAMTWRQGTSTPKPATRAQLVQAVRQHAAALVTLADAVEREGKTH